MMLVPNLERIADTCLARLYETRGEGLIAEHRVVVEALRGIWNARGAADLKAIEGFLVEAPCYPAIKALNQ